jgi:hypothetical protein
MTLSKKDIESVNCLYSDLTNFISEIDTIQKTEGYSITDKFILSYFSDFMESAKVSTDITIKVLENFGDVGKDQARNLKIKWGY